MIKVITLVQTLVEIRDRFRVAALLISRFYRVL